MTKLSLPFTEVESRALKVGDEVLVSGGVSPGVTLAGRGKIGKCLY